MKSKFFLFKKYFPETVSVLFILLFVYAATSKVFDLPSFNAQLAQSPLLTGNTGWIIWTIPSLEILIAVLLAVDRFRMAGLYAFFTMMVMFTAYIIAILNFSEFIPCSCGGVLAHLSWKAHLLVNTGFILLAALAIIFSNPRQILQPSRTAG